MSKSRVQFVVTLTVLVSMLFVVAPEPALVEAASHREAPLISMDPEADITDFFMFRSYEPGHEDNIVFIMDVIPGEEPSSGPNYYNFDPNVLYKFEIDNDGDGDADDISFEFRFTSEIRGVIKDLGLFLSYVALPPVTALDGPGSEGLGLRQTYSVVMRGKGGYHKLADDLFAVPSNVGPRTMPDYEALAAQGIYDLDDGVRVFAGQREDPFFIDLGGVFDTLNLRREPPLLDVAEDANSAANPFGVDMLSGFNVHSIAIEVPASMITKDGLGPDETSFPHIGAYASTSRQRVTVLATEGGGAHVAAVGGTESAPEEAAVNQALDDALDEILSDEEAAELNAGGTGSDQFSGDNQTYLPYSKKAEETQASAAATTDDGNDQARPCRAGEGNRVCTRGKYIQVQRLANPLVNEAIIATEDKDLWNAVDPDEEDQFLSYYLNPTLALALEIVYAVPAAKDNRTDLVDLLLKYTPDDEKLAELLRLDISVPPTPLADQQRLGPLAHDASGNPTPDPAAWPNGRRPKDDVTDIAVRVIGGQNYIDALAGDGVNVDDSNLPASFPFLATPFDGRNRVHLNP